MTNDDDDDDDPMTRKGWLLDSLRNMTKTIKEQNRRFDIFLEFCTIYLGLVGFYSQGFSAINL